MQKKVILSVILVAALALLTVVPAAGQGGGTMSTAFAVQNLGDAEASVLVEFYDKEGQNTNTLSQKIGMGENFNFDQRYSSGDPGEDSFQGSAIVSSDRPIGAAANMMHTGGVVPMYESYNALDTSGVGQDIILPQVLKNVSSGGVVYNTTIVIQNPDTDNDVDVDLVFRPDPNVNPAVGGTLTEPFTKTVNIAAGGTAYIDQADTPTAAQIGSTFFGSVRVFSEAGHDVAPIVYSNGGDRVLLAYPSYASGTTDEITLPSIYKYIESAGLSYSTAILIANFGDSEANVEIEYLPASGSYTVSGTDTVKVTAGAVKNVDQRYDAPSITSGSFMGGAVIKSTNGQPIAAMVNLRGGSRYAMTYGGLMGGGTTAYLPISYKAISSAGYSWSSTVIVSNLESDAGDATVNFTFYPEGASTIADSTDYTVSDIKQFDLRYSTSIGAGGANEQSSFIGAVKVESVGATPRNIGVMVQTRGLGGAGDSLMAFQALKK